MSAWRLMVRDAAAKGSVRSCDHSLQARRDAIALGLIRPDNMHHVWYLTELGRAWLNNKITRITRYGSGHSYWAATWLSSLPTSITLERNHELREFSTWQANESVCRSCGRPADRRQAELVHGQGRPAVLRGTAPGLHAARLGADHP
jgi:hypothetical protein